MTHTRPTYALKNDDVTVYVNARVIDPETGLDVKGGVLTRGHVIGEVGEGVTKDKAPEGAKVIDCGGKVLMPGLVNAHTHVPMTLLRGLADDLRLDVWLLGYMMPVEREFVSPDFVRLGTKIACVELIRTGVTCFADMYYFEEHVAQSTAEAGLRAVPTTSRPCSSACAAKASPKPLDAPGARHGPAGRPGSRPGGDRHRLCVRAAGPVGGGGGAAPHPVAGFRDRGAGPFPLPSASGRGGPEAAGLHRRRA